MAMKMSLTQSSIDEALEAYVRAQMPALPEETPIAIKLRATRGAGGYTADITLGEEAPKTLGAGRKVAAAKRQKAATAATPAADPAPAATEAASETKVEEAPAPAEVEVAPAAETATAEVEAEAAPAAPTPSIFGGVKTA